MGLISIIWVTNSVLLVKANPVLLNERGTLLKTGTKTFDKIYVALYPLFTFGSLVVMGFDAVRYQWSLMPFWLIIPGIIMLIFGSIIALWAMAVNKFFEWTVRIQDDRQQFVCMSGPYRIIRHPGYAGLILSLLAYPLILNSWWGFAPNGILAVIIIVRTALEDRTLQSELPGYQEYAGQAKYRLVPPVW